MWGERIRIPNPRGTIDETGSDQVCLGCTKRDGKPNLKIVLEINDLLESMISAGTIKQLFGWERSHADAVAWSCDMEGHA